jgi:translation initiation factor 2 alpha subunit (eIF-2alpha)
MYHYTEFTPQINTYCFFKLSPRRIKSDDLGIEVLLCDYNNLEVFIPITEINRKKFNITTFFKPETIYPGIVNSVNDKFINISYSKIKEEKREKLLKAFEIQTKIYTIISKLRSLYPDSNILNPITVDFTDKNYEELEMIYKNILLKPDEITSDENVIKYIINNRKIAEPLYCQHFMLTIINNNGLEILKKILKHIDEKYKVKIISSPLYSVEFSDLTLLDEIKQNIENIIKDTDCLFEMKELTIYKELYVEF